MNGSGNETMAVPASTTTEFFGEGTKSLHTISFNTKCAKEKRENHHMSTNLTAILQQLLQNTTNSKVLGQLMTADATYVSLNFADPKLKKVMPWTGTHKGPQALPDVFA